MSIDISVITPTWQRPQLLAHCLSQSREQEAEGLEWEHRVVSDGPDAGAERLCEYFGARFAALPEHVGDFGNTARDHGVSLACGEYLCFWDDDNRFERHALATLHAAAKGVDLGIAQIRHWERRQLVMRTIPPVWAGQFVHSQIDTACVCIRREFFAASDLTWGDVSADDYDADFHLFSAFVRKGARMRFIPTVIGTHI